MNVLLLPAGDTAAAVAERLVSWSAARALAPFCLWTADEPDGGAGIRRVADGHVETLPLADALAFADPAEIGFLAFCPLAAGELADDGFADHVGRFLETAAGVLDFDPGRPLTATMAVAPAELEQAVPPSLFRASWTGLYVAPEDRERPGAVNLLHGGSERFVPHAAHAAATLAEIWRTPKGNRPALLPELREQPAGTLAVGVRVVRCYSRIAELGHLADHVAAVAFERRDGWPRPDAERFDRANDPGPVVEHLARSFLHKHRETLDRRPFEPIREDAPPKLSLLAAFRLLVALLVAWVRRRPLELAEDAVAGLHDKAASYVERLAGSSSSLRVRRWYELPERERDLAKLDDVLDGPLTIDDGAVSETWSDLILVALGVVDGSELPADLGAKGLERGGRRTLVCDPSRIARDPAVQGDPDGFVPLLERVRAEVETAAARARETADALSAAEPDPDAEEDADEEPPAAAGWLTRLRQRLWTRRPAALRRFLALVARVAIYSVLALVATVAAWLLLDPLLAAPATLAVAGLWFVAVAVAARKALMRSRVEEDEQTARALRELNRGLELAQARGDAARLARRLDDLGAWIAILAEILHHPWTREPFDALDLTGTLDDDGLPAACAVAVTSPDRELLEGIGSRVRGRAFAVGWLSGVYRHVERLAMAEYARIQPNVQTPPDPTADTHEDRDSPRRFLLDVAIRGDGRRLSENPLAGELLAAIDAATLDELAPEVLPAGAGRSPLPPTTTWVAPPEGLAELAVGVVAHVVAVGSAAGVVVAPRAVLTLAAAVAHGGRAAVVTAAGEVVEPAAVGFVSDTPFAVLRFDEDLADGPPLEAAGAELRLGAGIFAVDPSTEGAVANWGFATTEGAAELGVVYDGARPRPGAPVLDLDGRLVALQGAGGTAHRVDDVAALLSAETGDLAPVAAEAQVFGAGPPLSASEFLAALAERDGERMLRPAYWTSPMPADANDVELELPASLSLVEGGSRLDQLADGAAFVSPLRVTVHRVEATRAVAPDDLAAG